MEQVAQCDRFQWIKRHYHNGTLTTANWYRGNSIHSNGTLASPFSPGIGIDLGPFGPTANDPGDSDTGP